MGSEIANSKTNRLNNGKFKENILYNIKSKVVMKKIVEKIQKLTLLKLFNYNKKIQLKLDLTLDDYKSNSLIEIELIPKDQGISNNFFINYDKNTKKYFHIFFDDNKEEVDRNYFLWNDQVQKIRIVIDVHIKSFKELFSDCICIKTIDFLLFKRRGIKDMSKMFYNCLAENIHLHSFNSSEVKDMSYMFYDCSLVKKLNLRKFKTANLENMSHMFHGCEDCKRIVTSNLNTKNVTNMSNMFYNCSSLKKINLSSFITEKVIYMDSMFLVVHH